MYSVVSEVALSVGNVYKTCPVVSSRYGMVNVDLYSAIITKVSNALDTLVSVTLVNNN